MNNHFLAFSLFSTSLFLFIVVGIATFSIAQSTECWQIDAEQNCNYGCVWCSNLELCVNSDTIDPSFRNDCRCEDISSEGGCNKAPHQSDRNCLWCPSISRCVTSYNDTSNKNYSVDPCSQCGYALNSTSCEVLNERSFAATGVHQCSWCAFWTGYDINGEGLEIYLCQNTTVANHSMESSSCSCANLNELQCHSIPQAQLSDRICNFHNGQCTSAVFPSKYPCSSIPNADDCFNSQYDCKWCEKELGGGCVASDQECSCYNLRGNVCGNDGGSWDGVCQQCELSDNDDDSYPVFETCFKDDDPCTCAIFNKSFCETTESADCEWNDQFETCVFNQDQPPQKCNDFDSSKSYAPYSPYFRAKCDHAAGCSWCEHPRSCIDNRTSCSCLSGGCGSDVANTGCTSCQIFNRFPHPAGASSFCINTSLSSQSSCQEFRCSNLDEKQCHNSQINNNYCMWCSSLSSCAETVEVYLVPCDINTPCPPSLNNYLDVTCSCQAIASESACSSPPASSSCHFCSNSDSCLPLSTPCLPLQCNSFMNRTKCDAFQNCKWQTDACVENQPPYGVTCDFITSQYTCLKLGCVWCDESNNKDGVHGCAPFPFGEFSVTKYAVVCSCMRFSVALCEQKCGGANNGNYPLYDECSKNSSFTLPAYKNARCKPCKEASACVYSDEDLSPAKFSNTNNIDNNNNNPCDCASIVERYATHEQNGTISADKFADIQQMRYDFQRRFDPGLETMQCALCPAANGSGADVVVSNVAHLTGPNWHTQSLELPCSCNAFTESSCQTYSDDCYWCESVGGCTNASSFETNGSSSNNNNDDESSMCACASFNGSVCPTKANRCQVCMFCEDCAMNCIDNDPDVPACSIYSGSCNCHNLNRDQCTYDLTAGACVWQSKILVGSSNREGYCTSVYACQNVLTCSGLNYIFAPTLPECSTAGQIRPICKSAGCEFNERTKLCESENGCLIFFLPSFVVQPVILLFLGFFKDFVVLLMIGAFGDTLARKVVKIFSPLIYKIREWDEKRIVNLIESHQHTVYIADNQCVNDVDEKSENDEEVGFKDEKTNNDEKRSATVFFAGSFSDYSKAVAVKLFDVVASSSSTANEITMKKKTTMILDAVHFSLVDNGLWIDLDSVDGKMAEARENESEVPVENDETPEQKQQQQQQQTTPLQDRLPHLLHDELFSSRVNLQNIVNETITRYASAFVFYRTSRDLKTRVANSVNSFPSTLQLVYYTASSVLMALFVFYSVVLDDTNASTVSQIANFTCRQAQGDSSLLTSSSSNGNKAANGTFAAPTSSDAVIGFWLIGFRLLNSSALSTAMLISVKVIHGLWQIRSGGVFFDELSLTQQLPLLSLYSSRSIHILLAIYFCIFAPFVFAGIFHGPTVNAYALVPFAFVICFALMVFIIRKCWIRYCYRSSDDVSNTQAPPQGTTPALADREERDYQPTFSVQQHAIERDSELATEQDENDENEEIGLLKERTHESTLANFFRETRYLPPSSATNFNSDNNINSSDELSQQLLVEQETENGSKNEEVNDETGNLRLRRALLNFLYDEELPTICLTLAAAMCFNYMLLTKYLAVGMAEPSDVIPLEWNARSVKCIAETFEGDISGTWSTLSSLLPFS